MKIIFGDLLFILWQYGSNLELLCNNANKSALRIMTPMTVFITASADFMLLILMKFWESSLWKEDVFQEVKDEGG
jgi:hypothetical protein